MRAHIQSHIRLSHSSAVLSPVPSPSSCLLSPDYCPVHHHRHEASRALKHWCYHCLSRTRVDPSPPQGDPGCFLTYASLNLTFQFPNLTVPVLALAHTNHLIHLPTSLDQSTQFVQAIPLAPLTPRMKKLSPLSFATAMSSSSRPHSIPPPRPHHQRHVPRLIEAICL